MQPVGIDHVQWMNGFLADRYKQTCEVTLKKLWDQTADPEAGHVLDNFRVAAGGSGKHAGTEWQDAWLYKWIEAASAIYKNNCKKWIAECMDLGIELIGAAIEDDGYISTQITTKNRPRFTNPVNK